MAVKLTKAQKFAFAVIGLCVIFLLYICGTQTVSINWSAVVTDLFTTVVGGFVIMSLTILTYRYVYHGRSKK